MKTAKDIQSEINKEKIQLILRVIDYCIGVAISNEQTNLVWFREIGSNYQLIMSQFVVDNVIYELALKGFKARAAVEKRGPFKVKRTCFYVSWEYELDTTHLDEMINELQIKRNELRAAELTKELAKI